MAGVNKCIFIGNLGRDPEVRYAQSGTAIGKLNLAVGERVKGADGEWEDHTEWIRVTTFGKNAENAGQYLAKGSKIYVEGRMKTSKYTDQSGVEKWSTEIIADVINYLDKAGEGGGGNSGGGQRQRQGGGSQRQGSQRQGSQRQGGGGQDDGFYDDDLSF